RVVDRRTSGHRRYAARSAPHVRARPARRRRHRLVAQAPRNGRHRGSRPGRPPAGPHGVDPRSRRVRAGMNFDLTEEQQQLRTLVREFAEKEVAPGAAERDQSEAFPIEIVKKMGALGLFGLPVPQEYGGLGADAVTWALVMEELGRVDSSVAVTLSVASGLAGGMVTRFGTAAQKERWLPHIATGEMLAGFALTEPSGGSDIKALRTTARLADGIWTIDGSRSRRSRWGSRKRVWARASRTRAIGRLSAARSARTRPSRSNSPTCGSRSSPLVCSRGTPPG